MSIDRQEGPVPKSDKKEENLAESVVAKVRTGLEEIESRPGEYFYYPFNYNLIFDLEKYLEMEETGEAVLKLIISKNDLLKKIFKRIKHEADTKQILVESKNTRKLRFDAEKEQDSAEDQNRKILESLEKLIQIGENK